MKKQLLITLCCLGCYSLSAQHLSVGFPAFQYDKGETALNAISRSVLDRVKVILEQEPTYMVLIDGHTDTGEATTQEEHNELSLKRAQAVADYLEKIGVDPSRLHPTPYGNNLLLKDCTQEGADCTDEDLAKNRRVELSIEEDRYIAQ